MPRLFAYIVDHDNGFAPNPFHGFCTLACCMPVTRRVAKKGDYVVGLTGVGDVPRVIYAMKVTDKKTFDEYWRGPRFLVKRPDVDAGGEKALGDNIYHWDGQEYRQEPSRHSNKDGTEDLKNKRHDTKGNDYWVLISDNFTYWGRETQSVGDLRFLPKAFERAPRGHRRIDDPEKVDAFRKWFDRQKKGRLGDPTDMDESKRGECC